MSWPRKLRTLFCCAVLESAALLGVPMRPEQIQDLMRSLNAPAVARTTPDDAHRGDGVRPDRQSPSGRIGG